MHSSEHGYGRQCAGFDQSILRSSCPTLFPSTAKSGGACPCTTAKSGLSLPPPFQHHLYRKAGYSKKFREEHEEEILLHQAAKNAFDEMGVKKLPKVKELQTEYAKLLEEKKKTYTEYRRSREEMRELLTAKANVDRVLKMEVEQDVEKEKDHGQR